MTLQAQVVAARAAAEGLCEDLCTIVDVSSTPDGYGGHAQTRTSLATGIPCVIESRGDVEAALAAGTIESLIRATIYMKGSSVTQAISPDQEIVVAEALEARAVIFPSLPWHKAPIEVMNPGDGNKEPHSWRMARVSGMLTSANLSSIPGFKTVSYFDCSPVRWRVAREQRVCITIQRPS